MAKPGRVVASITAKEASALPDWSPPKRGPKAKWRLHTMSWWLDRLDEKLETELRTCNADSEIEPFLAWSDSEGSAIESARRGNIEPLRKRYPHLAEFLHPPKPGRSKYQRDLNVAKLQARWAWKSIKEIRQAKYNGKKNKLRGDGAISDEEIVAHWMSDDWMLMDDPNEYAAVTKVDVKDVNRLVKPSGPGGRARAKPRAKQRT
jgi:hypothetical protein